jgi:pimeloyl-ACP methyl ester carboxylesterase
MPGHADFRVKTRDGADLHVISSAEWDASLPPIVFVPGMLGLADYYPEHVAIHAPRRIFAYSHRGLGKSILPEGVNAGFMARRADLEAVVEHFQLEKYFLSAFSAGVPFAVEHTLRFPERVLGLALMDFEPIYRKPSMTWVDMVVKREDSNRPPAVIRRYQQDAEPLDFYDRLSEIRCPVLIERGGGEGSLLSPQAADRMRSLIKNAELVVLPNSGHEPDERDRALWTGSLQNLFRMAAH